MADDSQITDAQARSALVGLVKRFPPWLPPLLFVMGGGTVGVGGFEVMLHRSDANEDERSFDDCDCDCDALRSEVDALERIVRTLLDEEATQTSEQSPSK